MSERNHLAAVVAVLRAGNCNAYSLTELKAMATLPAHFTEVHVIERFSPLVRGNMPGIRYWRIVTRAVGKSYGDTQQERANAAVALEGVSLTVDGAGSSPVERDQSDDPIGPDDTYFSGVSMWRYAL